MHLYFCLYENISDCRDHIIDEHTSNDSLQSGSSFLLLKSSRGSVGLIICDTVLHFSAIMYYYKTSLY